MGVGYSEPSNGGLSSPDWAKNALFFVWYRQWLVEALEQNTTTCPEIFLVGSKKDLCVSTVLLLFFSFSLSCGVADFLLKMYTVQMGCL